MNREYAASLADEVNSQDTQVKDILRSIHKAASLGEYKVSVKIPRRLVRYLRRLGYDVVQTSKAPQIGNPTCVIRFSD